MHCAILSLSIIVRNAQEYTSVRRETFISFPFLLEIDFAFLNPKPLGWKKRRKCGNGDMCGHGMPRGKFQIPKKRKIKKDIDHGWNLFSVSFEIIYTKSQNTNKTPFAHFYIPSALYLSNIFVLVLQYIHLNLALSVKRLCTSFYRSISCNKTIKLVTQKMYELHKVVPKVPWRTITEG